MCQVPLCRECDELSFVAWHATFADTAGSFRGNLAETLSTSIRAAVHVVAASRGDSAAIR
jgi:hypothetical protein